MEVLITGSRGFVGQHLWEAGDVGFDIKENRDLLDYEQIRLILDHARPSEIYHLAAQAFVKESFDEPQRAFLINTIGSINLLEAVRKLGLKSKILLAGTSEEYGDAKDNSEDDLLHPNSPYAVSKIAMDYMGQLYFKAYGMHVVVTRAFNHAGPGRGEMYAESSWAKQIAEIEKGKREYLEHGNLESMRNYTDVRDIIKAYRLAIHLPPDVYNICSDQNLKMKEILQILLKLAKKKIPIKHNKALGRPSDFSFYPPSCEKFKKLTSWKPKIKIEKTLKDLLNDWRKRV